MFLSLWLVMYSAAYVFIRSAADSIVFGRTIAEWFSCDWVGHTCESAKGCAHSLACIGKAGGARSRGRRRHHGSINRKQQPQWATELVAARTRGSSPAVRRIRRCGSTPANSGWRSCGARVQCAETAQHYTGRPVELQKERTWMCLDSVCSLLKLQGPFPFPKLC